TNDGGFGMARALGFRFDHEHESVIDLIDLEKIEKPNDLKLPKIVAAVDVRNPLLGKNGATRVFGPQKRVMPDQVPRFEVALTKLADVVAEQFGFDYRSDVGAGAAGGVALF